MKILYLVPDLSDSAVARRVRMFAHGGASVTLMGFRRSEMHISQVAGFPAIDLGKTVNAGFLHRILSVFKVILKLNHYAQMFEDADAVVARNLEMLAIGASGLQSGQRFVYEILDIHRLLLGKGFLGWLFRRIEGRFSKNAMLVITSSPAFSREYLTQRSRVNAPHLLVENKVFLTQDLQRLSEIKPVRPWVIGWFGILRCQKSFEILRALAETGLVKVVMRGRPALDAIPNFFDTIREVEAMEFNGEYKNPDDLAQMYGSVHFSWCIDYYEEGLNSSWLLPNRLYEGGLYQAVPIAIKGLETERRLTSLGIGISVNEPLPELQAFFAALDASGYERLKTALREVPLKAFVVGGDECRRLVHAISGKV